MSNHAHIESLLIAVATIISEVKHSREFNIIDVIGIGTREVYICRVLVELLNPEGSHNQGYLYLNFFFRDVLKLPEPVKYAQVFSEFYADGRPIDIVIKVDHGERVIPIEVKIHAKEQENQCNDYIKQARNSDLYYLTIDGSYPSDYSADDETRKKIKAISWRDSIIKWLENCIDATAKPDSLRVSLEQFAHAISNFCERGEKIMELIQSKPEYIEAAIAITDSFSASALGNSVLETIDKELRDAHKLKHPKTKDKCKTYIISDDISEPLFYRIHADNFFVEVGVITGIMDKEGSWVFTGQTDNYAKLVERYDDFGKGSGLQGWWLYRETIVQKQEFHLLFDEDKEKLKFYIRRIHEVYERICDIYRIAKTNLNGGCLQ